MKIYLGSDHAGFALKEHLKQFLQNHSFFFGEEELLKSDDNSDFCITVEDMGTHSEESVDYPDFAEKVAQKVLAQKDSYGIVICGTGIGVSIAANKVRGIRAALCTNETMARLAREHNDARILALGSRIIGNVLAENIVEAFLFSEFEGGRHEKRIEKIHKIEASCFSC
jgi:ribose 5-phosphate isomerase B